MMSKKFFLFDMDGVLLEHGGYHQALKASVVRIGKSLGAPNIELSDDQIAQFEALSVTNEWDSLAICSALILTHAWQVDGSIRLAREITPRTVNVFHGQPDFQGFLDCFDRVGPLPGESAYGKIIQENPWLTESQRRHLEDILFNCRDIYQSLTLPVHQEAVLGSRAFQESYQLQPKLNTGSFLLMYDQPILSIEHVRQLRAWLRKINHHVGILTNRPNATPPDYISAPEAEMGAKLVGLEGTPLMGSGMLNWYAESQCGLPQHTFLKPNPVHTLSLLQICLGQPAPKALNLSVDLWRGMADQGNWAILQGAEIFIFEDSVKGLQSGIAAKSLLKSLGIEIQLRLIGITENLIKKDALLGIAEKVLPTINDHQWAF